MEIKICSKCKVEKDFCEFGKNKSQKDGLRSECKNCRKLNYKLNSEKLLLNNKSWKLKNPDKVKQQRKNYYILNKEDQINYTINWRLNNPDKVKIYQKNTENRETRKNYVKEYKKYYKSKNPHVYAWRSILNNVLNRFNIKKNNKTIELLGYSAQDLKEHLESKFLEGMSWDNRNEWHIDHIIPVSSFDKSEKMSVVNSLDNLQPLWAKDNLSKGSKII
jgi:hypothetical protein